MNESAPQGEPVPVYLEATYRHKRTGGIYTTRAVAKMKSGEGEWESCIVYHRAEDDATFVRDFAHFGQNFELVEGAVLPLPAVVQAAPGDVHPAAS